MTNFAVTLAAGAALWGSVIMPEATLAAASKKPPRASKPSPMSAFDAGNGQVTTTPLPSSALASFTATNRTSMEIGFVITVLVSEKGGRPKPRPRPRWCDWYTTKPRGLFVKL